MKIGTKFQVGYNAKKYGGEFISRRAEWTEDCKVVMREDISYMVYYDLDREGYILHFNSALQIWQTNKIFGFGIKSFRFNCTYGVGQTCATHPHNYYLEILLDTGVVGLTLILLILVYSIFNFFNFYRYSSSANLKFFSIPFFIVFIVYSSKTTSNHNRLVVTIIRV